jgi:hypothetical protein
MVTGSAKHWNWSKDFGRTPASVLSWSSVNRCCHPYRTVIARHAWTLS